MLSREEDDEYHVVVYVHRGGIGRQIRRSGAHLGCRARGRLREMLGVPDGTEALPREFEYNVAREAVCSANEGERDGLCR